jgi:hypothetical protein
MTSNSKNTKLKSVGNPNFVAKWQNQPSKTIRLPKIFCPVLTTTAQLLDSGVITPEELRQLLTNYSINHPPSSPSAREIIDLIKGRTNVITTESGWEWTAKEAGLVCQSLEQAEIAVDVVFSAKAKEEVMISKSVADVQKKTKKPRVK